LRPCRGEPDPVSAVKKERNSLKKKKKSPAFKQGAQ